MEANSPTTHLFRTRICSIATCFVIAAGIHPDTGFSQTKEVLSIFTWSDYIDPALVTKFENQAGVKVEIEHFNSDDERNLVLSESEGRGFDLVLMDTKNLELFGQQNLFAKMNKENIPNLAHIDKKWIDGSETILNHGVPYFWGTLGIAYRKDLYPAGISTWKEFFDPPPELHNKISLIESSRDLYGMALKSLGHSLNDGDSEKLRKAHSVLMNQKPHVKSYEYITVSEKSGLVNGEIWASMIYNGDALAQQNFNENIVYVIPEEGSYVWVDYFAILRSSTRKQLAEEFLNFINEPRNATQNAEYVFFASPNLSVEQFASQEYKDNTVIHPPKEVMDKSESLTNLSPRAQKALNGYFADIVK